MKLQLAADFTWNSWPSATEIVSVALKGALRQHSPAVQEGRVASLLWHFEGKARAFPSKQRGKFEHCAVGLIEEPAEKFALRDHSGSQPEHLVHWDS